MFSLIITLVSIALVAALAVATIYYGGEVLTSSTTRAAATKVRVQGQQILGAAQAFQVANSRWPDSLDELVTSKYLSSVPQTVASASEGSIVSQAYALVAQQSWEVVQPGVPFYWARSTVPTEVCKAVNLLTRGDNGIYNAARPTLQVQCFGTVSSYTVLIGLNDVIGAPTMAAALAGIDPALSVNPSGGGWAVVPSTTAQNGSYLSSTSLDFATIPLNVAAPTQTLVFTNRGTMPLGSIVVSKSGSAFSAASNCPVAPATLAPGSTCSITVNVTPVSAGPMTGAITITSDGPSPSVQATLAGVGFVPPTLASLSTSTVSQAGGTVVTLTGSNFTPDTQVLANSIAVPTTYVSTSQVQFTTPPGTAGGTLSVSVANANATAWPSAALSLGYVAPLPTTQMTGITTNYVPWNMRPAVDAAGNIFSQDCHVSNGTCRVLKNGTPIVANIKASLPGAGCTTGIQLGTLWVGPGNNPYAMYYCDGYSVGGIISYDKNTGAVLSRATTSVWTGSTYGIPNYDGSSLYVETGTAPMQYVASNAPYDVAFANGTKFTTRTPNITGAWFMAPDGKMYRISGSRQVEYAVSGSSTWIGTGIIAPSGTASLAVDPGTGFVYMTTVSAGDSLLYKGTPSDGQTVLIQNFGQKGNNATLGLGLDGKVYVAVFYGGIMRID